MKFVALFLSAVAIFGSAAYAKKCTCRKMNNSTQTLPTMFPADPSTGTDFTASSPQALTAPGDISATSTLTPSDSMTSIPSDMNANNDPTFGLGELPPMNLPTVKPKQIGKFVFNPKTANDATSAKDNAPFGIPADPAVNDHINEIVLHCVMLRAQGYTASDLATTLKTSTKLDAATIQSIVSQTEAAYTTFLQAGQLLSEGKLSETQISTFLVSQGFDKSVVPGVITLSKEVYAASKAKK